MKKLFLIFLLSFLLIGCTNKEIDTKEVLTGVLNNEVKVIDETHNEIYLKDYKIEEENVSVDEYTFVDLDNDNKDELVILTNYSQGAYIVFHYDIKTSNVYGYVLGVRTLQLINKDGTFISSSGAYETNYNRLSFNDNKLDYVELAYSNDNTHVYRINNEVVTKEQMDSFINEWNKKEECVWIKKEQ